MKLVSRRTPWLLLCAAAPLLRCSSGGNAETNPPPPPGAGASSPMLAPGELCDATNRPPLRIAFDPPSLVLAPGQTRPVRVVLDPDLCDPASAQVTVADASVASGAPASLAFDLRHATGDFTLTGGASTGGTRTTTVTISMQRASDTAPTTASLPVELRDATVLACAAGAGTPAPLDASDTTATGAAPLDDAAVRVPAAAYARTDEFAMAPTTVAVGCGGDLTAAASGHPLALGPAVTFAPDAAGPYSYARALRREIEFAVPANPAAMPGPSRLRHLQVLFTSPRAKTPRAIPVANPRFEKVAGKDTYVLRFSSPWFGTYQAAVAPGAGTVKHTRHLAHRAVMGISMGGGAAAMFGLRHHDRIDAIGALGGPNDWTWLEWYIETYHLGGFCPASNPGCTRYAPNMYPIDGPFVHTQDYEHWYFQDSQGGGGTFDRNTYTKLFWDLTAMGGDALGQNQDPASPGYDPDMSLFPAGPKASDPWVKGDTTGLDPTACPSKYVVDCRFVVDSKSGDACPSFENQVQSQCNRTRCDPKNAWVASSGYYDDEYNPDGSLPVISVCDGNRGGGQEPYMNQWQPPTPDTAIPLNAVLAVDRNKNGVRDEGEPIIRSAHEPWSDFGQDGLDDAHEPGFDPATNPDPSQDDYDYALNPNGTEGNHHFDPGEPYQDVGLDGVAATKQLAQDGYDYGEADGKFTLSRGAEHFQSQDPHAIVHGWTTDVPAGPLDDDALRRIDVLADGGVRDLFNFAVVGNHLVGALAGRGVRPAAFYDQFDMLPGEEPGHVENFQPANLLWGDIADTPMIRYGDVDATPDMISAGDGAHVGTALQVLARIETAFYFAARRWTDADRSVTELARDDPEQSTENELGTSCEITGHCEAAVTGPKTGRTGPIAVVLPPGYGAEANRARDVRYPVLYALHGYGQQPSDLEALAIFTNNFMNDATRSYATRLPKFIVVYVDGRCRTDKAGRPECVRGTFYLDSARPDGAQMDTWFTEVMDYVDKNYRTMKPADVEVTD